MRIVRLAMLLAVFLATVTARAGDVIEPPIPPSCPSVVEMQTARQSQVTSVWLANGINIRHRHMPAVGDRRVIVAVNLWGSELLENEKNRGISRLAAAALHCWRQSAPGVATQFPPDKLAPLIYAYASLDSIQINMWATLDQFEGGMSILSELLTQPTINDATLAAARVEMAKALRESEANERNRFALAIQQIIFPKGEVRLETPSERRINAIGVDAVRDWIRSHIRENGAAITVSVVGEASLEQALGPIDRYLSVVPKRDRASVAGDRKLRNIARPLEDITATRVDPNLKDQSIVIRGFFGPNVDQLKDQGYVRGMSNLLVNRAGARIKAANPPLRASPVSASVYPVPLAGFSMFLARVEVDPGQEDAAAAILDEAFASLHIEVDQQELNAQIERRRASLSEFVAQPMFWTPKLSSAAVHGLDPDDIVDSFTGFATTSADVLRVMGRYDVKGARIRVQLKPPPKDDF